jgi:hypothetical protein
MLNRWAQGGGANVIAGLSPAAWFRFGQGITVTGAGVSQWDDQSGNARHLKQATDANRPPLQADGSILFDGVADFLKCDAFTLNQPETIYLLAKQVTWTDLDRIFDGNASDSGRMLQLTATPASAIFAGTTNVSTQGTWTLDTYMVVTVQFNGASSFAYVNGAAPSLGNAGASNMGGFTLGAAAGAGNPSNIQVKEVLLFPVAHDATTRLQVERYLGAML